MVDRFSANQDNITSSFFYGNWGLFQFDFLCQLARLFIGPEQHIQDKRDQREGHNGPQDAAVSGEQPAQLIHNQRHRIREHALIADDEKRPLGGIHIPLDDAHSRETGGTQQIEYQEGVCCCNREACCQRSPDF